jgi:hypothetical protein
MMRRVGTATDVRIPAARRAAVWACGGPAHSGFANELLAPLTCVFQYTLPLTVCQKHPIG